MEADTPEAVTDGILSENVLLHTRFSAAGFVFDNRYGLGCVPDAANVAYRGAMVLMKPSTFLSLTPPDGIRSAAFIASAGGPLGSPYLELSVPDSEDGPVRVREHEGRSRMTAILRRAGDDPVPVCLFLNVDGYSLRAHEMDEELLRRAGAGAMRERRGQMEQEWVEGPLFEDVMVMVDRAVPTRVAIDSGRMPAPR